MGLLDGKVGLVTGAASGLGRATAERSAEVVDPGASLAPLAAGALDKSLDWFDHLRNASGDSGAAEIRLEMQRTMQAHAGVFRTQEIMEEGDTKLEEIWKSFRDGINVSDRSMVWNSDMVETIELDNLLRQSTVTLKSAINRKESRGGHAREDFPERNDENWMKHTAVWLNDNGEDVTIDYRPVHMHTLTDEIEPIPPKKRVY